MIALAQFMDTITRARNCSSWNGATNTGTGQQNLNGIGGDGFPSVEMSELPPSLRKKTHEIRYADIRKKVI